MGRRVLRKCGSYFQGPWQIYLLISFAFVVSCNSFSIPFKFHFILLFSSQNSATKTFHYIYDNKTILFPIAVIDPSVQLSSASGPLHLQHFVENN